MAALVGMVSGRGVRIYMRRETKSIRVKASTI